MPKSPSIFINYRRQTSRDIARLLHREMEFAFGAGSAFLDTDKRYIPYGEDWPDQIRKAIRQIKVLVVLVSEDWFTCERSVSDYKKIRKLDAPKDWVRLEIECVLERLKNGADLLVIPVLLDEAEWPPEDKKEDAFPPSLLPLFSKEYFKLQDHSFNADLKNLIRTIGTKIGVNAQERTDAIVLLDSVYPLPNELAEKIPDAPSPYFGLKRFEEKDARLFFGRNREIFSICGKIINDPKLRVLLLDGYSGTGKSSLLHAGIIPRMKGQGWAVAYGRREEDKVKGLSGVFERLSEELESGEDAKKPDKLLILDQLEEVLTNPIDFISNELEEFIGNLDIALRKKPRYKFILGFRSEYTAHMMHALKGFIKEEGVVQINTLYPLDRNGVVEAISGVNRHKDLQEKFNISFSPADVPELIAERLLDSRIGYHIAPLLQVNMQLLWQKCRHNKEVKIFKGQITELIDSREKLLHHYLEKIRKEAPEGMVEHFDLEILEILNFYTQLEPVSAIRSKEEFLNRKFRTKDRSWLWEEIKKQHLVSSLGEENSDLTRLSHDVLAEIISVKYRELEERDRERTQEKLEASNIAQFELRLERLVEQLEQMKYIEAQQNLEELMDIGIRRNVLKPYLFEMLFFWNEAERKEFVLQTLELLLNSALLMEAAAHRANEIKSQLQKEAIREWLRKLMTPNDYEALRNRYLAPAGACMAEVEGGGFQREGGGEVKVDRFRISNVQTTFRKYGLYLYAAGEEKKLEEIAPNWGVHADHPVVKVNWYDAVEYCNWLSEVQGLPKVYTIDKDQKDPDNQSKYDEIKWLVTADFKAGGYRLPTEAEWEFAARGGKNSGGFEYAGSKELDEVGWYSKNSSSKTHPVAQKRPNELGLYDMSGNVWEWCWDWYGDYPSELVENPDGPETGSVRVLRGGSWLYDAHDCRAASRIHYDPGYRFDAQGFRLVFVL